MYMLEETVNVRLGSSILERGRGARFPLPSVGRGVNCFFIYTYIVFF